jgi:chemotaxis protein methyltransferase WspC
VSVEGILSLLRERFGLDPRTHGEGAIERAIRVEMERAGIAGDGAYLGHLRADPAAFDALATAVLVPETWFFRYPRSFDLLAGLARQRPAGDPFRVLSVPCSTGEEPYSAAIAILDDGFDAARLRVVAVDVHAAAIATAREGRYGRNSFRGDAPAVLARHGRWEGDTYVVGDPVRAVVEWRAASVLDPGVVGCAAPYDVILCRNLLIYLGAEERRRVMDILAGCLAETGWLLVGHGEVGIIAKSPFRHAGDPAAFAAQLPRAPASESPPAGRRAAPPGPREVERTTPRPTPTPVRDGPPPARRAAPSLDEAERAANGGHLERARELCEAHLQAHPASARAHYLLGVVHASLRDDTAAQRCLERAVYLDPDHHEALVHLALQAQSRGDDAAAAAWHRRAARALARRQPTEGAP